MRVIGMNNVKLGRNGGGAAFTAEYCHLPQIFLPFLGELENLESFFFFVVVDW